MVPKTRKVVREMVTPGMKSTRSSMQLEALKSGPWVRSETRLASWVTWTILKAIDAASNPLYNVSETFGQEGKAGRG